MADFTDPFSALSSGINQGVNIALTVDQTKRQRSQREQELALKAADSKLELAKTFKKDPSRMMSLISSAADDYRKAGVDVPDISGASFSSEDASKELSDALSMWSKNVSSGSWDADFGRKWLIQKGSEIGSKGDEINALTQHAYNEALKEKGKEKIDPFVFDSMAAQMGLNPEESAKVREKFPKLLSVPIDQLKTAIEAQTTVKSQENELKNQLEKADIVLSKVDEALTKTGKTTTGFGSLAKYVPGTSARDYSGIIETIKSGLGLGELKAMRAASKTGASGFGALSEKELSLLESSVASLDQGQSPAAIKKNLNEIYAHYSNWKNATQGTIPTFNTTEEAEKAKLRSGTTIIVGGKPAVWEE